MIAKHAGVAGVLTLAFLLYAPFVRGEAIQRTIFKVENLTCGYCLSQINAKMQTLDGYMSMGANLARGIVGIDHKLTLESNEIAEAISSIGYPATVISASEIDEKDAFSLSGSVGASCCGSGGAYAGGEFDQNQGATQSDSETFSQGGYGSGACCSLGKRPVRGGYCGGGASSWQELKRRFFD